MQYKVLGIKGNTVEVNGKQYPGGIGAIIDLQDQAIIDEAMSKSKIVPFESGRVISRSEAVAELGEEEVANIEKEADDVEEVEMGSYKILGAVPFGDEEGNKLGELEVDSIQSLPVEIGDSLVIEGLAERVDINSDNQNKIMENEEKKVEGEVVEGAEVVAEGAEVVSEATVETEGAAVAPEVKEEEKTEE